MTEWKRVIKKVNILTESILNNLTTLDRYFNIFNFLDKFNTILKNLLSSDCQKQSNLLKFYIFFSFSIAISGYNYYNENKAYKAKMKNDFSNRV